jgi:flavin-dependent dehydrogenase
VDDPVDVLIVGGGPAGAATALALAERGIDRTRVVTAGGTTDLATTDPAAIGHTGRPCRAAVPESAAPGVAATLARWGAPADFEALGHARCYGHASVWGSPAPVVEDFVARAAPPAWHIDRARFDAWLLGAVERRGASVVRGERLAGIERERGGMWRAHFDPGSVEGGRRTVRSLRARVVVDATGRRAALARKLGARRCRLDDLVAVSAVWPARTGAGLAGHSLVVAVKDGWWFAAAVPGDARAIGLAFLSDADVVAARRLKHPEAFAALVRATPELGVAEGLPPEGLAITTRAAGSAFLDRAAGTGWLAVGDALVAFDPLTSSGLSGALEDAAAAADTIHAWLGARDAARVMAEGRAYARRARITLGAYVAGLRQQYARERRWPTSAFWARRVAGDGDGDAGGRGREEDRRAIARAR